MPNHPRLSREKPERTLLRSNVIHTELQDVRCEVCKKILYQDFVGVHAIVPGHPDTKIDTALLDINTIIIQCHGMLAVEKNGETINTRCSTRYFVT